MKRENLLIASLLAITKARGIVRGAPGPAHDPVPYHCEECGTLVDGSAHFYGGGKALCQECFFRPKHLFRKKRA